MMNLENLEKLHASVRSDVEVYARNLGSALGAAVKSIAVYGSSTGADYLVGKSNVNIVVVVDGLTAETLARILKVVEAGKRRRIVPPLLVTPDYVKSSADVFPIEYLEIRDSQVVIYGEDFFSGVETTRDNLRLECESQLRAAVLRTRQAYLELGGKKRGAEQVLHASVSSLVPVFRAMLRLKGEEPPRGKLGVIQAMGEAFGIQTETFTAIVRDRSGDEKIGGKDAVHVLGAYIDEVEAIVRRLDQM
jgi:hypothetical protein